MIKAVLFDVGGTLIHLDRRFVVKTLNDLGHAVTEEDFLRAHAVGTREIGRVMRSEDPGTDATRWRTYGAALMREMNVPAELQQQVGAAIMERHAAGKLWSLVEEGTADVLEELKADGYRLGIISNADGRIKQFLEDVNLAHYFDVIIDSELVGIEKPDPRIFHLACEQMKIEPSETIYIGDIYEIDVAGARAAGIRAILLYNGDKDPEWDAEVIPTLKSLRSTLPAHRAPPTA